MNVEIYFAIAQHNLTVVGLSGSYVKPIVTDVVMISPGQTMDILVTANQPLDQYYMAARQYDSIRQGVKNYDKTNVIAILEYRGNYTPSSSPIFPNNLPTYADFSPAVEFMKRVRCWVCFSLAHEESPSNKAQNPSHSFWLTCDTRASGYTRFWAATNIERTENRREKRSKREQQPAPGFHCSSPEIDQSPEIEPVDRPHFWTAASQHLGQHFGRLNLSQVVSNSIYSCWNRGQNFCRFW